MHTLSRFGMKKFAGAVLCVLAYVLDNRLLTTDNRQTGGNGGQTINPGTGGDGLV